MQLKSPQKLGKNGINVFEVVVQVEDGSNFNGVDPLENPGVVGPPNIYFLNEA